MGRIPLAYVLLSESSMEIIHYFFEVYRRKWGTIPIDFGEIVMTLSCRDRSTKYVKYTIRAQRTYFLDLKIDWNHIIDQSLDAGEVIMKATYFAGSSEMSCVCKAEVGRRRRDCIDSFGGMDDVVGEYLKKRDDLERYILDSMQIYHDFLVDITTVLELVLWRMVLKDTSRQRKRKRDVRIDTRQVRMIRLTGGKMFQAVIPNVLSFL
jgi:hypothetical protein